MTCNMSGISVISVAPIPVQANRLAPATPLMVIEARIYTEHGGNLDVALQLARTAKQILPDQPEVNDTLEQALRVQPDFSDATDARRLLNDLKG